MIKNLEKTPIKLYTIGFTKKNAETFFALLEKNKIRVVIDIRRNNSSQLAIFSKFPDLSYFLENLSNIKYKHFINLAPPSDLLKKYRNKSITWEQFEKKYIKIIKSNDDFNDFNYNLLKNACLLCSEDKPDKCHRRLLAELFKSNNKQIDITHL